MEKKKTTLDDITSNKYIGLEITKHCDVETLRQLNVVNKKLVENHIIHNEAKGNLFKYINKLKRKISNLISLNENYKGWLDEFSSDEHGRCNSCSYFVDNSIICPVCQQRYCYDCVLYNINKEGISTQPLCPFCEEYSLND